MDTKSIIRKKFFFKRKKKYFEINKNFYHSLIRLFKKKVTNKNPIISFYYPSSFELNILSILDIEYFKKSKFLLPIIEENDVMNFYKWNKNDILAINKYGMLEPIKSKKIIEKNNNLYESMLDKTAQSLEKIISNTESISKIQ